MRTRVTPTPNEVLTIGSPGVFTLNRFHRGVLRLPHWLFLTHILIVKQKHPFAQPSQAQRTLPLLCFLRSKYVWNCSYRKCSESYSLRQIFRWLFLESWQLSCRNQATFHMKSGNFLKIGLQKWNLLHWLLFLNTRIINFAKVLSHIGFLSVVEPQNILSNI